MTPNGTRQPPLRSHVRRPKQPEGLEKLFIFRLPEWQRFALSLAVGFFGCCVVLGPGLTVGLFVGAIGLWVYGALTSKTRW